MNEQKHVYYKYNIWLFGKKKDAFIVSRNYKTRPYSVRGRTHDDLSTT